MGIELDMTFNAHKDKTREGQEGLYMIHAHDVTQNYTWDEQESTKEDSQESQRGTTAHYSVHQMHLQG